MRQAYIFRYLNYSVKLIELIALYGYALTIWMPITVLSVSARLADNRVDYRDYAELGS